jgi:hypothetical protein
MVVQMSKRKSSGLKLGGYELPQRVDDVLRELLRILPKPQAQLKTQAQPKMVDDTRIATPPVADDSKQKQQPDADRPLKERIQQLLDMQLPQYQPPSKDMVLLASLMDLLAPAPLRGRAIQQPFTMADERYRQELDTALRSADIVARLLGAQAQLQRAETPITVEQIRSADREKQLEFEKQKHADLLSLQWARYFNEYDVSRAEIAEKQARALNLDTQTERLLKRMPLELLGDLDRALLVLGDERASPLTQQAGVELLISTLDKMREHGLDVDRAIEILRTAQEQPEKLKSYAQSMFDLQAEKVEQEIKKLQAETELQLKRIGLTEAQIEKIKQETINSVRRLQQIDRQLRIAEAKLALERAKFEADLTYRAPAELRDHLNTLIRLRGQAVQEVINHIKLRYPSMRTDTLVDAQGNPLPATQVRSIFERSGFAWTSDLELMWRNAIRIEQQINRTIREIENKYRRELERSF